MELNEMNQNANDTHFYFNSVPSIPSQQASLFHHHGFTTVTQPIQSSVPTAVPLSKHSPVQNTVGKSISSLVRADTYTTATRLPAKKTKAVVSKKKPCASALNNELLVDAQASAMHLMTEAPQTEMVITNLLENLPASGLTCTSSSLAVNLDDDNKTQQRKISTLDLDTFSLLSAEQNSHSTMYNPQVPLSPNFADGDKGKMNIEKLENTIDHVLSLAISDQTCDDIFVLPSRLRDAAPASSPTPRPSTPSSGINPSPAPSPLSSSPHLNQPNPTTQLQSPTNSVTSNSLSSNSLPKYVIDNRQEIVQLNSSCVMPQQYVKPQFQHQSVPAVLQVCPDTTGSTAVRMAQQHVIPNFACQPGQSILAPSATQVIIRPALYQNVQVSSADLQSNLQSASAITSVQDGSTTVFSPVKFNPSPNTITVPMALLSPEATRNPNQLQQSFSSTKSTLPDQFVSVATATNVSILQKTMAFGTPRTSFPTSLFVTANSTTISQPAVKNTIDRVPVRPEQKLCTSKQLTSLKEELVPVSSHPAIPIHTDSVPSVLSTALSTNVSLTGVGKPSMGQPAIRKRHNASLSSTTKKRRSNQLAISAAVPGKLCVGALGQNFESTKPTVSRSAAAECVQHLIDKLKSPESKDLVSDPRITPFSFVLPPYGACGHPVYLCSSTEDGAKLKEKGLKYNRSPFTCSVTKRDAISSSKEAADLFMIQHVVGNTPSEPMLHTILRPKSLTLCPTQQEPPKVCASPEPASFENNLMSLYSNFRTDCKSESNIFPSFEDASKPESPSSSLLPMLLRLPKSHSMDNTMDRCTPPLSAYHIPNPELLTRHTAPPPNVEEASKESPAYAATASSDLCNDKPVSSPASALTDDSQVPMVDMETGEVLGGRRPKAAKEPVVVNEKLHVTFTINSSMTDSVPEVIRRITALLGIDNDSISYQVTRSGTQITFGQSQTQSENVIRDLESHLRQHFTPLSMHLTKSPNDVLSNPNDFFLADAARTPTKHRTQLAETCTQETLSTVSTVDDDVDKKGLVSTSIKPVTSGCSYSPGPPAYSEETMSISKLLAMRREAPAPCKVCDQPVQPDCSVRKRIDELAISAGLVIRPDSTPTDSPELTFCSDACVHRFSETLTEQRARFADASSPSERLFASGSTSNFGMTGWNGTSAASLSNGFSSGESKQQLVVSEACPSGMPILLQNPPSKSLRTGANCKRGALLINIAAAANLKRKGCSVPSGAGSPKSKRWKAIRWRAFSSDMTPRGGAGDNTNRHLEPEMMQLLRNNRGVLRNHDLVDSRACILCNRTGDATENGPGRLLCTNVDEWMHLNCSLWCFEVYETLCGSLNNERACYERAKRTSCSHCGLLGAGLPCYNPRCSAVYHIPCAQEIGCMFFTDRGMYCPLHQPKEHHPMELSLLAVNRRVYVTREENDQVAEVIHEEDQRHIVRIGGLSLLSVGQLLPHQLESGNFHTQRYIFPVGFRTMKIYWSMRKPLVRCRYICEIEDRGSAPFFLVTAVDDGLPNEQLTGTSCHAVWGQILARIANLRLEHGLVKIFPQYIKTEELFGLSEPHIVRAIESLPGVDQLRDYVFKFGRMQLIAEMPLAINPSGCARCEPKMRTYIKRFRRNACGATDSLPSAPLTRFAPGGSGLLHRNHTLARHPGLVSKLGIGLNGAGGGASNSWYVGASDAFSRQSLISRSQQYRRLTSEVNVNIILGRSRIQGLGLFAARDLDQAVMVIEYIGELIRVQVANKREKEYEAHNRGIYMFRLDEDTVVDATVSGGLARYINHSCEPNCSAEYVCFGEGYGHIVIMTTRKLHKGEELTYDYNFDLEDCTLKIPCHCGAPNCRKWMN